MGSFIDNHHFVFDMSKGGNPNASALFIIRESLKKANAFIRRRPLYLELRYEIPKEVAT
ncbi:hypothetical protein ACVRXF_00950 [Streptococcus orisasini]